MKVLYIFACLLALSVTSANAATSGEIDVLRVEVSESWFAVYSNSGNIGTEGCQDESKVVFWREDFTDGYDSMLSVALAAHVSERKVTMWLTNCKTGPWSKTLPHAGTIVIL